MLKLGKMKTVCPCLNHTRWENTKEIWFFDVSLVKTSYNIGKHLKKNKGEGMSQPEYAKIIDSVMYLMNYTLNPKLLMLSVD